MKLYTTETVREFRKHIRKCFPSFDFMITNNEDEVKVTVKGGKVDFPWPDEISKKYRFCPVYKSYILNLSDDLIENQVWKILFSECHNFFLDPHIVKVYIGTNGKHGYELYK